jgi:S1-C subfamily serine protease
VKRYERANDMRTILLIVSVILLILMICSCAASTVVPREAFVKIISKVEATMCDEDDCEEQSLNWYGSGVIVKHTLKKSFILTAAHICNKNYIADELLNPDELHVRFRLHDHNGITHKGRVYKMDIGSDLCILRTRRIHDAQPIELSGDGPYKWEKVYNLAGPMGFAGRTYVPLVEGYYSGFTSKQMIFTCPAIGGSSGSPIFNRKGELVGMISAVHTRYPIVSMSPHYHIIKKMVLEVKDD